jgi:hypothetical protein
MPYQGFNKSLGVEFYIGQKCKSIKVLNTDSTVIKFSDYCLKDLDRKLVKYYESDTLDKILSILVSRESGRISKASVAFTR